MSGDLHTYYDHPTLPGDAQGALRDELKKLGHDVVLAHTGGGCMSIDVILSSDGRYSALVGIDPCAEGGDQLATSVTGGADLMDNHDDDDPYIRSVGFDFAPGKAVEHIHAWLVAEKAIIEKGGRP